MNKIILTMIMGIMFLTLISAAENTNVTDEKFTVAAIELIMSFTVFIPLILLGGIFYFFYRGGSYFINPINLIIIVCLATLIAIIIMPAVISVVLEAIWG